MTKFTKLIAAVAMLWLVAVQATPLMAQQYDYDFQVGQLFYKKQKDVIHKSWVTVVPQKSSKPHYSNELTGTITIPATVVNGGNTYIVKIIGRNAFEDCSRLTSINIPNGVWTIRPSAFENCSGLTSITLPNSVTSIEARAFYNCSGLTSINIPSGLIVIEADAFSDCSGLTSITLPNSVKTIGACAFCDCSGLTSINIPNSVTTIKIYTFFRCSGLTSINIPNSVTTIEPKAFYNCSGLTSINIPSSVTSIGKQAFSGCSGLKQATVPGDINFKNVFDNNSNIDRIVIAEGSTNIGKSSFSDCSNFKSITIPGSVKSIGDHAFSHCSGLTSINIPNSVTTIGKGAFSSCRGLTSITIPGSVKSIGDYAFSYCSGLTSITLPNSLTKIEYSTFSYCSGLTSINIPNSVEIISQEAFNNCTGLKSVTVGWQTPPDIPGNVFNGVQLNNVKLIVPRGTKAAYRKAYAWKKFNPIIEDVDHTITYNQPTNGTLKVKSDTQEITSGSTVKEGTILTIEATPDQHYKLDSIRVNGKRSDKLSIMVEENTRIEAFFGKEKHSVTYVQSVGGTLTVKDGGQEVSSGSTVEYGTVLTIEATPDEHYKLDSIRVNGKLLDKLSITVEENTRIEAFFGKEKYTVKYNNPYGGKLYVIKGTDIVTSGEGVEYGTELTVKTIPDAGFKLKSLTLNGQTIPDNYKFTISEPVTIEVVFTSVGTGLDETSAAAGIVVYPNPVVDILRIATDTPIRTIRVFNIYGREVARATDTDRIDLSHLPAGVYTVRADGKTARVVKK